MNYKETDPFITKYYDKFIDIMRKENHPLLHEMMTKMKTDDVKEVVMWLFENSDEVQLNEPFIPECEKFYLNIEKKY